MGKTWCFSYYGWFGPGDSSDDIDYETDISDREYKVLSKIEAYMDGKMDDDFDCDAYIKKNQSLIDSLRERVYKEIEEEDASYYSEDEEKPSICVRWPWE